MVITSSPLAGVEPSAFWAHFEAITRIPRPSGGEQAMVDHVRAWSAGLGFAAEQDATGNLLVHVPATAGREGAATVILQGHLDMVCERRPDSPNDPAEGRISLVRDGEWLKADGTTLGADDGVAIAAMMALAEDVSLPHGPLELLMTVAEEVGLEGANGLDGSMLTGSVLLNLDSEEDGRLTVGCAGSTDTWIRIERPRTPLGDDGMALAVVVSGGLGGHSGSNIADGRSNAIKVLGRALRAASASVPLRLVSLDGGRSRNAIPRDATAVVSLPTGQAEAFRQAVAAAAAEIRDEFARTDAGIDVAVIDAQPAQDAWSVEDTGALLDAVAVIPTGPLAMSPDFAGVVETSSSLGEATTEGGRLTLHSLSRSSNDPAAAGVIATLGAVARLVGGELEVKRNHGAWRPDLDSPALAVACRVFERELGHPPVVTATHAGLEPAVIGSKATGLDMLSLGPEIQYPHSPDERISVPTVERFWRLLVRLVDELSSPSRSR
ncbi:MAG TPA: beta-Ala-His dipeptidase [Gaiellales bacterium]|nr:beta-Ala-His dipeptidase [Gaiellales bacterium]